MPAEIWPRPLLSRSLLGLWRWPPDDRVHLPFATHQRIRLWGVCVSCHLYANLPCPGARPLRSNCSSRPVSEYTCQSFAPCRAKSRSSRSPGRSGSHTALESIDVCRLVMSFTDFVTNKNNPLAFLDGVFDDFFIWVKSRSSNGVPIACERSQTAGLFGDSSR